MIPADCCRPLAETSPSQLSRSTRAPLLRWKWATGSSARPEERFAQHRDNALVVVPALAVQQREKIALPCLVTESFYRRSFGGQQEVGGCRPALALEPGSEACDWRQGSKNFDARQLDRQRVCDTLDQKVAKADPGEAALAVRD